MLCNDFDENMQFCVTVLTLLDLLHEKEEEKMISCILLLISPRAKSDLFVRIHGG